MDVFSISFLEDPGRNNAWFDFCSNAFGGGEELADYFRSSWNADPSRSINRVLTARNKQGELLSSLTILSRKMQLCRRAVSVGGIATVCTRPDQQGKGIAGQLLRKAISYMEERGDEISLLGTAIPDYYRRFGWERIASRRWEWIPAQKAERMPGILHPPSGNDWEAVGRLYEAEVKKGRRNGMLHRKAPEDWAAWLARKGCRWMVCEDGEGIRSYCGALSEDNVLDIREFGCRDGAEDDFSVLTAGQNWAAACDTGGAGWNKAACCAGFPAPASAVAGRIDGLLLRLMRPLALDGRSFQKTEELIGYLEQSEIPFSFSENDSF